jgi:hypothetical protein
MKSLRNRLFHLIVLGILCIGSAIVVFPATAAATISVAPVWHPGTQLTTLTAGPGADPFPRYVDVEVWATSNTPFWSVQLTCTVAATVLQDYTYDPTHTGDPGDDVKMVRWGPAWGNETVDFTQFPGTFNASTGTLTTAAARLGNAPPLGSLGTAKSILVATVHYKVKTAAGSSPFTCLTAFLDSNGNSVGTATYTAPTPLTVIAGYTISGSASYQARSTKSGIGVNCFGQNTAFPPTVTDASGKFSVTTRKLGNFTCVLFGNITSTNSAPHPDLYPKNTLNFSLNTQSYMLLPIVLAGGNVDQIQPSPPNSPNQVEGYDLTRITANYNLTTPLGDANGDGKTNQADLSIVAGNYLFAAGHPFSHVLYGLPRSWVGNPGPDNRIWLGESTSGRVTQIGTSTTRDLWPMLSPDGSKIAFTRQVGNKYSLFIMKADGTSATPLTPASATYNAYAPSWSPDGSRIAFDCAHGGEERLNNAHLCLIDVTGRNFQEFGGATIYPPAWLNNTQLLYGGSCVPNWLATICLLDPASTPQVREFSPKIEKQGTITFDEPSVATDIYGGSVLFYRINNGSDRHLRYALLNPGAIPTIDTWGISDHFDVDSTVDTVNHIFIPISTDVDYYTVSTLGTLDIMMYNGTTDGTCTGTSPHNFSWNLASANGGLPIWPNHTDHSVDNAYCNPSWDGDPTHPTDLWAQRNTFNWVP